MFLKYLILIFLINKKFVISDVISETEIYEKLFDSRLESDIYPLKYEIWLKTDIHNDIKEFSGRVLIDFVAKKDLNKIQIDDFYIKVKSIEVLKDGLIIANDLERIIGDKYYYYSGGDGRNEFVTLQKDGLFIEKFKKYQLNIKFTNILRESNEGFFYSTYYIHPNVTNLHPIAATHFETRNAHATFPCFDIVGIKSIFILHLTHHKSYNALSNTPGTRTDVNDPYTISMFNETYYNSNEIAIDIKPVKIEDYVTTTFEETPLIPIYTLAFVVSDFTTTTLSSTIYPEDKLIFKMHAAADVLPNAEFVFGKSDQFLNVLENYLDMKYPLSKMDQVIVPSFNHMGMENFGLIIYHQLAITMSKKFATSDEKTLAISIGAHEFSHQFFGNMITPWRWPYVWLSEGFCSYMEEIVMDKILPDQRHLDLFLRRKLHKSFEKDLEYSQTVYDEDIQSIVEVGSDINYSKASSIIRMISHVVSEETFHKVIKFFVHHFQYKSVDNDDLYFAINHIMKEDNIISEVDIKTFITSWITQSSYPVLTVNRDFNTGKINLGQEQFYPVDSYSDRDTNSTWWLPYNYAYKSNPDFINTKPMGWMKNESTVEIDVNLSHDEWIIFNKQQIGYYLVNYDKKSWELITNELVHGNFEIIHPLNRAQLIHDAFKLSFDNYTDFDVLINLLVYLNKETDFIVWKVVDTALEKIEHELARTEYSEKFKEFILLLTSDLYDELKSKKLTYDVKITQSIVLKWSCKMKYQPCIRDAESYIERFLNTLNDTEETVNSDLLESAILYGIDSDELYTRLWSIFPTDYESFKKLIIKSLNYNMDKSVYYEFFIKHYAFDATRSKTEKIIFEYDDAVEVQKALTHYHNPHLEGMKFFHKCVITNCHNVLEHPKALGKFENTARRFAIFKEKDLEMYKEMIEAIAKSGNMKVLEDAAKPPARYYWRRQWINES